MLVAIHQPNFFPWLGYFGKLTVCDCFVFLDNVQLSRQSYCTRVQVRQGSEARWLSVPLDRKKSHFQKITAAEIVRVDEDPWPESLIRKLQAWYRTAPHATEIISWLNRELSSHEVSLADLNIRIIKALAADLDVAPRFVRASDLPVHGSSTDLLVDIVKSVGGTVYVRGAGALAYQDDDKFRAVGIVPSQLAFHQEPYPQLGNGFLPGLSVLDALFNCGFAGTAALILAAAVNA